MGFAIMFFLAWLVTGIFVVLHKELSIVENTFVFLISLIVIINFSWIIIEEVKLIHHTKISINYVAYLLERSIVIPMLLLVQLNIIIRSNGLAKRILIILCTLIIMLGVSYISTSFNILVYKKWNFLYDLIYYLLLQIIAFYSYKLMKKVSKNVVKFS
jgi:hypothetical protein